jgi:CarD family transcriptional regulator
MKYTVGAAVVYGEYGATTVREITTTVAAGKAWTKLVLGFPFDSADPDEVVRTLLDHQCLAPLSEVLGSGGVPAVLAVLAAGPVPDREPDTWGANTYVTMIGGITTDAYLDDMPAVLDACQVAEVVRNLTVRQYREPLGVRDAQLLDTARRVLVSEVALGAGVDRTQAETAIDEALATHRPPSS